RRGWVCGGGGGGGRGGCGRWRCLGRRRAGCGGGGRRRRSGGGRRGVRGGRGGRGRSGTEGGEHHEPAGGRAEGQAPLLRPAGAGQNVLEERGGAPVAHVEDVRHPLAASGNRVTRLAAGDDGRHDQLAGEDR